jgi:hypothetical protein
MGLATETPWVPDGWLACGLLTVLVTLLLSGLRRSRRQMIAAPRRQAQERVSGLRSVETMNGDMQRLLTELEELARQTHAQIDTRFAKLEASVRSADERIDKLQRLLRAAGGQAALDTVVGGDDGLQCLETPAGQPAAAQAEDGREAVYALADAGRNHTQIAQATGRAIGEVELILALRGRPR